MIAVIDNYDSFTFNLVQILRTMQDDVRVFRNDAITVEQLESLSPDGILISPGPGNPSSAGISCSTIERFAKRIPLLGVCLGHQSIGQIFGGRIVGAKRIVHGKTSQVTSDQQGIFRGIPPVFQAMRYHSLVVERATLPACLEISATSEDGEIMGLRLKETPDYAPVEGIQFHPESIMTPVGKKMLRNFVALVEVSRQHYLKLKGNIS